MTDAPLNPHRSSGGGGGIGPIDLDESSAGSNESDETFEEPRFLCTPRGRLVSLFCVLVLAAVGIALGVTQPWNNDASGTTSSLSDGTDSVGGLDDDGDAGGNASCFDSVATIRVAGDYQATTCATLAASFSDQCDRNAVINLDGFDPPSSPLTVGDLCRETCGTCDTGDNGTDACSDDSGAVFNGTETCAKFAFARSNVCNSDVDSVNGGDPLSSQQTIGDLCRRTCGTCVQVPAPTPSPTYYWQAKSTPAPTPVDDGGQNSGSPPGYQPSTPSPNDFTTNPPNPSPTTPAPTLPPVGAAEFERYRQFVNAIITAGVSPPGTYSSSAAVAISASSDSDPSPQQSALNWLAFVDPLGLDAEVDPALRIIQRYSAAVLYYGMKGANWKDSTGWLSGEHECDWYGVTCQVKQILAHSEPQVQVTVDEEMVTEFNLNGNNLFGLLPLEIGAFPFMDTLGMYDNIVGGEMPTTIGNLTKLERLWLDANYFQGTIPTEVGLLVALKQVDIFTNNFNGQLPTQIGNLGNLTRFSAYDNELEGTLPSEFGSMKKMKELFLDTNQIGGPIPGELGGATELRDVRLFQNDLTGAIPAGLSGLSNVKILYLDNNDLTGQIPATAVAGWTSLIDFQAFKNDIGGSVPEMFGALPELSVIVLADNDISDVFPPGLCMQGSKLLKIDLSGNDLDGSIPTDIEDCAMLQRLHLDRNELDMSIPTEIGQLGQLKSLHLNDNTLQGAIPSQIGDLTSLEELHLQSNMLTGSVPGTLCGQLTSAQADCEGINEEVVCACCTLCCGPNGCLAPQVALPGRAFIPP